MASQGPLSPGTLASATSPDGNTDWENPGNAASSNDVYAHVFPVTDLGASHWLKATNFGFSIPAGATIDGVLAEVEVHGGTEASDSAAEKLVKAGVVGGSGRNNNESFFILPSSDQYLSYGSSTDKWGNSLSADDVNDSGFGFVFQSHGEGADRDAFVDHMRLTVFYSVPANSTAGVFDPQLRPEGWF